MSHHQNIMRIKAVYNALEELATTVVFVGGATVSLYADRITGEVRPTDDVDIVVEMMNYHAYSLIEEKLRQKGFVNDTSSGVICRYKIQGIIVDIMPVEENTLGFTNKSYKEGYATANYYKIDNEHTIKIFQAPLFLASKFEAFNSRGRNDGRGSSDFEDIVFIQ